MFASYTTRPIWCARGESNSQTLASKASRFAITVTRALVSHAGIEPAVPCLRGRFIAFDDCDSFGAGTGS